MWGQLLFEMYLFTKDLSDLITSLPPLVTGHFCSFTISSFAPTPSYVLQALYLSQISFVVYVLNPYLP
jgi:hypothetical protein